MGAALGAEPTTRPAAHLLAIDKLASATPEIAVTPLRPVTIGSILLERARDGKDAARPLPTDIRASVTLLPLDTRHKLTLVESPPAGK